MVSAIQKMFGSDLKLSPNSFFVSKFIFLPQKSFFVSKFTFWTWTHLIILVFLFSYFLSYTVLFSDYHSLITFLIYHSFHASPSFKCLLLIWRCVLIYYGVYLTTQCLKFSRFCRFSFKSMEIYADFRLVFHINCLKK